MACSSSLVLRLFPCWLLGLAMISLGRPCAAVTPSTNPTSGPSDQTDPEALGIVHDLLTSPSGKPFNWEPTAYARLRALGPKAAGAVPILVAQAHDPNPTIRAHVFSALAAVRLPTTIPTLIEALEDSAPNLANIAKGGLVDLGPAAVPMLESSLNGADRRGWMPAIATLGEIDPEGYKVLMRSAASHRDLSIRTEANRRAGVMIPALVERLHGKDVPARSNAVQALIQKPPSAMRSLLLVLGDPDPFTRRTAAEAIGRQLGLAGGNQTARASIASYVGDISAALSNPDPVVGNTLAEGLAKFPEGRAALIVAASVDDPRARAAATRWLGTREPIRAGVGFKDRTPSADVAALVKALSDPAVQVRIAGAEGLEHAHEKSAIDPLSRTLLDPDGDVRLAAGRALLGLGPDAADALASGLRNSDAAIRLQSAQILRDLGPAVATAVGPLLSDTNVDVRRAATNALYLAFTQNGSPKPLNAAQRELIGIRRAALKELLRDRDPSTQTSAAVLLQIGGFAAAEDLAELLRSNDPRQRRVAIQGLIQMPPQQLGVAASGLADVIRGDPENRLIAAQVLGILGPSASVQIFNLLASPDTRVRSAMQSVLAGHATSVELLRKMLRDSRPPVRAALLELMRGFNAREEAALLDALKDADPAFRAAAIIPLGGDRSAPARAALRDAARDADPMVRIAVVSALDPRTEKDLILALAHDPVAGVRAAAITRLADALVTDPAPLIPAFIAAMPDGDEAVRAAGAGGLAKAYSIARHDSHKPAMPAELRAAMENAIRDKAGGVRVTALKNLLHDPQGAEPFLPTLIAILKDAGDRQRPAVIPAVAVLARDHPPAMAALLAALSDQEDAVREAAASAFVTLDDTARAGMPANRDEARKHLPELAAATSDASARVRLAAALALLSIQPNHPAAGPALLTALKDKDPAVRLAAVDSLWRISLQTPGARPALLAALEDPDPRVLRAVVQLLTIRPGSEGQPGGEGTAGLGLFSQDASTRRAAAEALGQGGSASLDSAGRLLETATGDADVDVRHVAAKALKKILTAVVQTVASP